jgi:hypothetical protein
MHWECIRGNRPLSRHSRAVRCRQSSVGIDGRSWLSAKLGWAPQALGRAQSALFQCRGEENVTKFIFARVRPTQRPRTGCPTASPKPSLTGDSSKRPQPTSFPHVGVRRASALETPYEIAVRQTQHKPGNTEFLRMRRAFSSVLACVPAIHCAERQC